jgi:hypothetical protein
MPTKHEHTTQAKHNRAFWSSYNVRSTQFLDWVVTGIFYEGVHWVEAYLDINGEHSGDHKQRLINMRRYSSDMRAIIRDFDILKQESENARYSCYKFSPNDISNDLVPIIDKIKNHIQNLL